MKNTALLWCSTVLAGVAIAGPAKADTWALLVGVGKYQNPSIKSLNYPPVDAAAFRDALSDPQLGAQPADRVKLLTDEQATRANILGAVDGFLKDGVKKGDQVVLFLAGHGVTKGVGLDAKSYLLPTDAKGVTSAALEESGVDLKALSSRLAQLPASQFVVFVDACREDPTPGRGIKGNTLSNVMSRNVTVIPQDAEAKSATFFACSVGQRAYEDERLKHGVFTHSILKALRQAAVPDAEGKVDLSRLGKFVSQEVANWAKETSQSGSFDVEQTPELVTAEQLRGPIILMQVKRPVMGTPIEPDSPKVTIGTLPEGAQVSVNGKRLGAGAVSHTVDAAGEYTIRVEAPGYAPVERSVQVQEGYQHQLLVQLQPGGAKPESTFQKAVAAEARGDFAAAAAGYDQAIREDAAFAAAYERRAALHQRQGQAKEGIGVLVAMLKSAPKTARGYALLSRAYSEFALKEADFKTAAAAAVEKKDDGGGGGVLKKIRNPFGRRKKEEKKEAKEEPEERKAAGAFRVPEDGNAAAALALKAAELADALDESSPAAKLALGVALLVNDPKGSNREDALAALDAARDLAKDDAEVRWGAGFGRRHYAAFAEKAAAERQLKEAIAELEEALKLRTGYYEAHLELAYCHHLLGQRAEARRHYELANACRGDARDKDEVAGANVALSALYGEEAKKSKGEESKQYEAASRGYEAEASEVSPNLDRAVGILLRQGLGGRLHGFLPTSLSGVVDRVRSRLSLPSLPGVPGLPGLPGIPSLPF